jgi:hypothetical protein
MAQRNYFLVSALPAMGDLGAAPPLAPADLCEHVAGGRRPIAIIEAVFLGDDLRQREAVLAGETEEVAPAVLTPAQVRDEEPLPAYLAAEEDAAVPRVASDALWAAYFRHAAGVGRREGSPFLAAWVAHEVALRNALAAARAKALGLEAADYLVAPDLGSADEDFGPLVNEWAAVANPLDGLKVLDRARWHWLTEHEAWFSFGDDELAAYAAKLMLLARWYRLRKEA